MNVWPLIPVRSGCGTGLGGVETLNGRSLLAECWRVCFRDPSYGARVDFSVLFTPSGLADLRLCAVRSADQKWLRHLVAMIRPPSRVSHIGINGHVLARSS